MVRKQQKSDFADNMFWMDCRVIYSYYHEGCMSSISSSMYFIHFTDLKVNLILEFILKNVNVFLSLTKIGSCREKDSNSKLLSFGLYILSTLWLKMIFYISSHTWHAYAMCFRRVVSTTAWKYCWINYFNHTSKMINFIST